MSNSFGFKIITRDGFARAGSIFTSYGEIETPVFMPVATTGAIKYLTPDEVRNAGAKIILSNIYHLIIRPGLEVIKEAGGISKFMKWDGPVLTDSGGYQVFSLAKNAKISDEGVTFNSHVDGTPILFTPELVIEAQTKIGSTIAMPLDVCPSANSEPAKIQKAVELTTKWLDRTLSVSQNNENTPPVFGICQGGCDITLRKRHLEEISTRNVAGIAIGGMSVGEKKEETRRVIESIAPLLPPQKPRYLMGMGKPEDILHAIFYGIDMFDCVFPTRAGRHGMVLTWEGSYSIRQKRWEMDRNPLDENCTCPVCTKFDRSYLRHIYRSGEKLSGRLISLHNLYFYFNLVRSAKEAILCYNYKNFYESTCKKLNENKHE